MLLKKFLSVLLFLKHNPIFPESFSFYPRLHRNSYQTTPSAWFGRNFCVISGKNENLWVKIGLNFSFLVRSPRINILHSYRKGLCILTSWQKINIANCSGLEYQINYIYQNSTVQKFLTSMTTDKHSYCVSNLKTAGNISQVEIRGIFRKNLGLLSMKNVSFNSTMVNVTKRPTAVVTPVSGKLFEFFWPYSCDIRCCDIRYSKERNNWIKF